MGIEELVVKHRHERGEIAAAHRRIALVLEGEDFLVAAHRQTSLAVSPGTSGLQLAWRLLSLDQLVGGARAPAIRRTERYGILARRSLRLDIGGADHLAPLLSFVRHQPTEVGGRADSWCATQIGEPRLDLMIGESGVHFVVELLDDFGRSGLRRADAGPGARLVTRQEF